VPPEPVPNAVIVVPAVTPVPVIPTPTLMVPEATAETVSVVPEIEPVNSAGLPESENELFCAPLVPLPGRSRETRLKYWSLTKPEVKPQALAQAAPNVDKVGIVLSEFSL